MKNKIPTEPPKFSNKQTHRLVEDEGIDNLAILIDEMLKIDLNSPLAKLNETTITDNNGGRIEI